MTPSDLHAASPGTLVKNLDGHASFVPNDLPPALVWDEALIDISHRATQAVAEVCGIGGRFPQPQRLMRLFLRREAELSSRIEQTHASVRTMLLFDEHADVIAEPKAAAAREVTNNYNVLHSGIDAVMNGRPISLGLLRALHAQLFDQTGEHAHRRTRPGRFREVPVFLGDTDRIEDARFVPPPPLFVDGCMEALERFIRKPSRLPAVVRAAIAHYQFEVIHPFNDGNGRIGRALILLMLVGDGLLPVPLLNPSAGLERKRRQYYDRLLGVSLAGEWDAWIKFFCTCVLEEAHHTVTLIGQLDDLRTAYHQRIRAAKLNVRTAVLIDELFATPAQTGASVAKLLAVTLPTANATLQRLQAMGIMREVTGRKRDRVFMATEIVDLFSDQPSTPVEPRKTKSKAGRRA